MSPEFYLAYVAACIVIVIAKRGLALAARFDVGIFECGIDEPQRRDAELVTGLHRILERVVDVFAEHVDLVEFTYVDEPRVRAHQR